MTPAARVQAAIEVLDDILGGVPAEKALTGWARRSRFAGSATAPRSGIMCSVPCGVVGPLPPLAGPRRVVG